MVTTAFYWVPSSYVAKFGEHEYRVKQECNGHWCAYKNYVYLGSSPFYAEAMRLCEKHAEKQP